MWVNQDHIILAYITTFFIHIVEFQIDLNEKK